jgi:hypothetical protein
MTNSKKLIGDGINCVHQLNTDNYKYHDLGQDCVMYVLIVTSTTPITLDRRQHAHSPVSHGISYFPQNSYDRKGQSEKQKHRTASA